MKELMCGSGLTVHQLNRTCSAKENPFTCPITIWCLNQEETVLTYNLIPKIRKPGVSPATRGEGAET